MKSKLEIFKMNTITEGRKINKYMYIYMNDQ